MICDRNFKNRIFTACVLEFVFSDFLLHETIIPLVIYSENQIVEVGSRSRRAKSTTKRGNVDCDWFILPLLLPTPTIWFSLDPKRNVSDGVGRNGNVLILLTPIPTRI